MSRTKHYSLIVALFVAVLVLSGVLGTIAAARQSSTGSVAAALQLVAEFDPPVFEINSGQTATFNIEISNPGSVALETVVVTGSPIAACNRSDIGPLAPGDTTSYTCEQTNLTANLLNEIVVTATDAEANETVRQAGGFAKVRKPVLLVEKTPVIQTVAAGGRAQFLIKLFNLSATVVLTNVTVDDSGGDGCDLNPSNPLNLAPGETRDYLCSLPDVRASQTTIATAQGFNGGQSYTDTHVAWVKVVGLEADLTANPVEIVEPGGPVTYTVELSNPGSFPVTLTELSTDLHGDILDPDNATIDAGTNTCLPNPSLPIIQPYGGSYTCSFSALTIGQPPGVEIELTAKAEDQNELEAAATATAAVAITDLPASIDLSITADPPFINPPGRQVNFNIRLENTSAADKVTINQMSDSELGNLSGIGTCSLPQLINAGAVYECTFSDEVQGQLGEQVSRTITASGVDDEAVPGPVSDSAIVTVTFTEQIQQLIYMPSVSDDSVGIRCNDPYPMQLGRNYQFLLPNTFDGQENWGSFFRFTTTQQQTIRIEITNFVSRNGQIVVWENSDCTSLVRNTGINTLNTNFNLGNRPAGTYIIQLINDGQKNNRDLHGIRILVD